MTDDDKSFLLGTYIRNQYFHLYLHISLNNHQVYEETKKAKKTEPNQQPTTTNSINITTKQSIKIK